MMIGKALKRLTVVPAKHAVPEGTQEPLRGATAPANASTPTPTPTKTSPIRA